MAKFLVTYHGGDRPADPEMRQRMMDAFTKWAAGMGGKMIDPGAPHRGGSTGTAGYQHGIDHQLITINPGGCAPARSDHSVITRFDHYSARATRAGRTGRRHLRRSSWTSNASAAACRTPHHRMATVVRAGPGGVTEQGPLAGKEG